MRQLAVYFEQLRMLAGSLTRRQQISLAVAVIAVVGGLIWFVRWRNERDFETLAKGLSAEDAGQVVARLKETNTEYRIDSKTGEIKIRSEKVAETRMQLAAEGLPKTGRAGFELFDKVNLGTTEFAEKINFQRALEGELERSVATLAEVRSARIHLSPPKESIFLDKRQPAKASVLLTLKEGIQLDARQVQAIAHLVASAVDGLALEDVSILDSSGTLLSKPKKIPNEQGPPDNTILQFRQAIEKDLLTKINSTLDPVLGVNRFRAAVTVDCDFTTSDESEESFDPTRSVMSTSQRTEDTAGASQPNGVPGTSSTLPRATSRPGANSSNSARRTENVTYQTSRLVRRTHLPQGIVRRISASVLLDHSLKNLPNGAVEAQPPSAEQLRITKDLVAGVIGLQTNRGDQLVVEALPFESTLGKVKPPPAPPRPPAPSANRPATPARRFALPNLTRQQWIYVGAGTGAFLLLLAAGGLLFWKKRKKKLALAAAASGEVASTGHEVEGPPRPRIVGPDGKTIEDTIGLQLAENAALKKKQEQEMLLGLKLPGATTSKAEVLVKRLAEEAKRDPAAFAHVVRTWMADSDR